MNRDRLFKIASLMLLLIVVIVTLGFTSFQRKQLVCTDVNVFFDNTDVFVTSDQIEKIIQSNFKGLKGAILDTVNTERIESKIEENPWVFNAEVFKGYVNSDSCSFAGGLKVHIEQEVPLLRVVNGSVEYYVNKNGRHLPFSASCTSNVLVVSGYVSDAMLKNKLLPFVDYLDKNNFWKALIQQVDVQNNEELILVPRAGDHLIKFGKAENIENKFRNLKAVYTQGFNDGAWNKYKTVSLRYNNQVICKLK
jgi:cell division protein FtsQ